MFFPCGRIAPYSRLAKDLFAPGGRSKINVTDLLFFADLVLAAPENRQRLPILAVQLDAPKSQLPQV